MGVLPSTESLRMRALEASWQRGRRVSSRRIAWRWTVWFVQRPSVVAVAMGTGLAVLLWAQLHQTPNVSLTQGPEQDTPAPTQAASAPPAMHLQIDAPTVLISEGGMVLRWIDLNSAQPLVGNPLPALPEEPIALQLDTQLNLKEPQ